MAKDVPVIDKQLFPVKNVNSVAEYYHRKSSDCANQGHKMRWNPKNIINAINMECELQCANDKFYDIN